MRRITIPHLALLLVALLAGVAACDRSPASPLADDSLGGHDHHLASSQRGANTSLEAHGDLLKSVRQATARFNSTTQAVRNGYAADDHCVAHPELGAMGYHWVNGPLIDPAFDPLQPEVLLYAPGDGGNLRLVGVEYIVIDVGQPHPHFGDHPFDVGGVPPLMEAGVAHWSLHVWVHEDNPSGPFAPFNPNVSCG